MKTASRGKRVPTRSVLPTANPRNHRTHRAAVVSCRQPGGWSLHGARASRRRAIVALTRSRREGYDWPGALSHGRLAQSARAPRLHRGGRGFESLIAHFSLPQFRAESVRPHAPQPGLQRHRPVLARDGLRRRRAAVAAVPRHRQPAAGRSRASAAALAGPRAAGQPAQGVRRSLPSVRHGRDLRCGPTIRTTTRAT